MPSAAIRRPTPTSRSTSWATPSTRSSSRSPRGGDGVLRLDPFDAQRLAQLLDEAAAFERAHPAHLFAPPEPREREIGRVELAVTGELGRAR